MIIPVKPTKQQAKANKAKRKEALDKASEKEKARAEKFKNDPGAAKAVRQMTTKQGYDPDPLAQRGYGQTEMLPNPRKSRPKFRIKPKY